ncbi:MAG: hypothetical protein IT260_11775 [Saprospiraceae bacterium]|nr:hypothetical protein [Saprospiraceae bacterium]
MKTKLLLAFVMLTLLGESVLFAQNPGFNYQAVIRDKDGVILTDKDVDLEFIFFDKNADQKCSFDTTIRTNDFGVANVVVSRPCIKSIRWYEGGITMRVWVNGAPLPGAQQMNYVPYAILADSARNARVYSAGTGVQISGAGVISLSPTVDTDQTNDLLKTDVLSGDVTGLYNNTSIAAGAVTNGKLAANAVTTDKIQDGTIQPADLSLSIVGGLWTSGANNSAYRNVGNVGVGTTTPESRLHVASAEISALQVTTTAVTPDTKVISARVIPGADQADAVAVDGEALIAPNIGIGGRFRGGYYGLLGSGDSYGGVFNSDYAGISSYGTSTGGFLTGGNSGLEANGSTYGVYSTSSSTGLYGYGGGQGVWAVGGTYGIYASGSTAGYFSGNVVVTSGATISGGATINSGATMNGYSTIRQFDGTRLHEFNNTVVGGAFYGLRGSTDSKENFVFSTTGGAPNGNYGYFSLKDAAGTSNRAGMYLTSANQGYLFADLVSASIKNFRMKHPEDPTKEIWYACIEGPEAAAYERGSATLTNGQVTVNFSEHFKLVANSKTMTVILTPLSADSKGLAVIEKTETGFVVKELLGGTGTYAFDWEVKCVRKGYENYQAVREAVNDVPNPAARD